MPRISVKNCAQCASSVGQLRCMCTRSTGGGAGGRAWLLPTTCTAASSPRATAWRRQQTAGARRSRLGPAHSRDYEPGSLPGWWWGGGTQGVAAPLPARAACTAPCTPYPIHTDVGIHCGLNVQQLVLRQGGGQGAPGPCRGSPGQRPAPRLRPALLPPPALAALLCRRRRTSTRISARPIREEAPSRDPRERWYWKPRNASSPRNTDVTSASIRSLRAGRGPGAQARARELGGPSTHRPRLQRQLQRLAGPAAARCPAACCPRWPAQPT